MTTYKLKDSVKMELNEGDLMIVDMETGFVGKGNKHAYQILSLLSEQKTVNDVVNVLKSQFHESQIERIEKSVPSVLEWAVERDLVLSHP